MTPWWRIAGAIVLLLSSAIILTYCTADLIETYHANHPEMSHGNE